MNEQYAERLVSPTRAAGLDTQQVAGSTGPIRTRDGRVDRILFVGMVLVIQVSWLGLLAYGVLRLL